MNQQIMQALSSYTGNFNERVYKDLKANGLLGSLADMIRDAGGWHQYSTGGQRRAFRTNSGTTDYVALAQPVELAGDFSVEWTGQVPTIGGHAFCNFSGSVDRFAWRGDGGFLITINGIDAYNDNIPAVAAMRGDGKLHRFNLSRTGTALTLTVGGVGYSVGNSSAFFDIDRLMSKWSSATSIPNYAGVMSDVKITSNGTLIHHWPMNEGAGSTHIDVVGNNNGTIINGQPTDWERFERLPGSGEWVGRELVTNGDFSAGATGWALGPGWSVSDNKAKATAAPNASDLTQVGISNALGKSYRCNLSVSDYVAGQIRPQLEGVTGTNVNADGYYSQVLIAATGAPRLFIRSTANGTTLSVDNISVRRILQEA